MTKKEVNQVAYEIVGCAIEVHKQVGPRLLESVYEICLVQELKVKSFQIVRQLSVPITYKGVRLDAELRLDLFISK